MIYRNLLLLFAIIIFINACTKQQGANTTSTQLKSTQTHLGDSVYYQNFEYDMQGRLVTITDSMNFQNYTPQITVLTYNPADQLQKAILTVNNSIYDMTFFYNNTGQIIRRRDSFMSQIAYVNYHEFTYDNSGRLTGDTVRDNNNVRSATSYTYDPNDNITSWQYSFWNNFPNAVQTFQGTSNSAYGQQPNPYSSLGKLLYFIGRDRRSLSKNNILSENNGQVSITYTYQFNSMGLPIKMIVNDPSFTAPYNLTITDFYY